MHDRSCFITLTYDDEHLPDSYSVDVRTWQLFAKKVRKHLKFKKIRFFMCGEYGDKTLRPHYHALIFGHDWPDRVHYSTDGRTGAKLYTSETLTKIWSYGFATTGDVNYKSAAYVARYAMKKIGGDKADEHYWRLHPLTQTLHRVQPEFCLQSRRPGIGTSWFNKFKSDVFPSDFLVVDGQKRPVPAFYTLKLKEEEQLKIKRLRKKDGLSRKPDQTPARLRVREEVKTSQLRQLKRGLE